MGTGVIVSLSAHLYRHEVLNHSYDVSVFVFEHVPMEVGTCGSDAILASAGGGDPALHRPGRGQRGRVDGDALGIRRHSTYFVRRTTIEVY
jgi:hypothetical protein